MEKTMAGSCRPLNYLNVITTQAIALTDERTTMMILGQKLNVGVPLIRH